MSARCAKSGNLIAETKRQTFQKRYGVDNGLQSESVQAKVRATNLVRYGAECSFAVPEVKEKIRLSNLERYGVDWHTQSANFKRKAAETWMTKYGVDHPMRADEVKAKYDFRACWAKAHVSKKQNGTYAASAIENKFYDALCEKYGAEDVERQKSVDAGGKRWFVDFYVKSTDTYIQFDGAYWHGTNRPLEIIEQRNTLRDKAILKAYARDREQDAWFASKSLTLLRVTDAEFLESINTSEIE